MIEELIKQVPPITRVMCFTQLLLSLLTYIEIVKPYSLQFNAKLVFSDFQFWRIMTNIFYIGDLTIMTIFRIILFYRFSSKLEEHTFRGNAANYCYFITIGIALLTVVASSMGLYNLSDSFQTMIVYLWCRRNKNTIFHVFGLIPVQAPYLAWFFVMVSLMLNDSVMSDIVGIGVGHIYYFLADIYPNLPLSSGNTIFKTPQFYSRIFLSLGLVEQRQIDEDAGNGAAVPEEFEEDQDQAFF